MTAIWIGDSHSFYHSPTFSPSSPPPSITHIHSRAEASTVLPGQLIKRWDYIMRIKSSYLYPAELDLLRNKGDLLADRVVEVLGKDLRVGVDGLEMIRGRVVGIRERRKKEEKGEERLVEVEGEKEVTREEREGEDCVLAFWENIHESYKGGKGDEKEDEDEEDLELQRQEGRDVFWKYSTEIFGSLLHFSLAGGFSAPKLAAVMKETNYLTSTSKEATYKRLLETTLFVIDAMTDMKVGTGKGWKSAVRVRILHAQVRRRIALGKGKLNQYDVESLGIPINQQDLCTVLGSFMIAPLWSLKRLGFNLTKREKSSFQLAWKEIGFYLGIEVDLLEKFYGGSHDLAEETFACLGFDAFQDEIPEDGTKTSTYQILDAVSGRPPRQTKIGYHLEYTRKLLGPGLSTQLAIPRGSLYDRYKVNFDVLASYTLITFGTYYPFKRWENNRRNLMKRVLELIVIWQLGSRRTLFAYREELKHSLKFGEDEGEEPGIEMGVKVGLAVKKEWKLMIAEVVAVGVGIGLTALGIGWVAARLIL